MSENNKTNELLEKLEPWRDMIEDMTPFGETPEEVMNDGTIVQVNAPRALMAQAFQSKILMMAKLKDKGLLRNPNQG